DNARLVALYLDDHSVPELVSWISEAVQSDQKLLDEAKSITLMYASHFLLQDRQSIHAQRRLHLFRDVTFCKEKEVVSIAEDLRDISKRVEKEHNVR
ncbi:MAG: hypothetical protein AAGM67_20090, partial [Bacteroidota bacterium]